MTAMGYDRVNCMPIAKPSQSRCLGCTLHVPGHYWQLAGENGDDTKYIDHVFLAGFDEVIAEAIKDMNTDPKSLAEAQLCPDWPQWKEAMDHKIAMLEKANTWRSVPQPHSKNIIGCKWVFLYQTQSRRKH
jgi:hypothetical protein